MVTGMPARASSSVATAPTGPPPATMTRSCLRFKVISFIAGELGAELPHTPARSPALSLRSLPPCGGGLGRGVAARENVANSASPHHPHPCPLPTRGRGTQEPKHIP